MLKRICPAAADMSRRVGEFVAGWEAPGASGPLSLLEIGCGTGVTTLNLLSNRRDADITAVDNEPAMLSQARRNLAEALEDGRVRLVENDALSFLREAPAESFDIVATAYTLHNFLDDYRHLVLREVQRVLRPGGLFISGDRYALDDTVGHLRLVQDEARHYFRVFASLARPDLLEQWIIHLFSDESPDHVMRLEPALACMGRAGFDAVTVHFRDGVNALVSGGKPWR
jgi:tRNA (cmo5U34)-methyltransferase